MTELNSFERKSQTIEIDCAPMGPRPDFYLPVVLEGTGIEPKLPKSTLFGNWEWDYSEIDEKTWASVNHLIEERIRKLHDEGKIRYGSW